MLYLHALQIKVDIVLIDVWRQTAFTFLPHPQSGDLLKGIPLLESCQGVVQDHGSYTALEKRQEVLLLHVSNAARHVIEQNGVEIRSDGTIVDRASLGRLVSAPLHLPIRTILEDGPETRVKLMATGDDQQASG